MNLTPIDQMIIESGLAWRQIAVCVLGVLGVAVVLLEARWTR